jgi:hypothetical protein
LLCGAPPHLCESLRLSIVPTLTPEAAVCANTLHYACKYWYVAYLNLPTVLASSTGTPAEAVTAESSKGWQPYGVHTLVSPVLAQHSMLLQHCRDARHPGGQCVQLSY